MSMLWMHMRTSDRQSFFCLNCVMGEVGDPRCPTSGYMAAPVKGAKNISNRRTSATLKLPKLGLHLELLANWPINAGQWPSLVGPLVGPSVHKMSPLERCSMGSSSCKEPNHSTESTYRHPHTIHVPSRPEFDQFVVLIPMNL